MYTVTDIIQHGQQHKCDRTRVIPSLKPYQFVSQGDLNFTKLPDDTISSLNLKQIETPSLQLAPGNTKGSRHCLKTLDNVEVYEIQYANPLQSVVLKFKGETEITHPEHGNLIFDGGTFAVTFQLQHAKELKRIAD